MQRIRFGPVIGRFLSFLALVGAGAVLALGTSGPTGGETAKAQGGGASGSFGNRADAFLSFAITGGNLKLRPGTNNWYEGTWNGGRISLSGEMTVSRSEGSVSYVTMSARINDKSWRWPPEGQDGKVTGQTVTQHYKLTYSVPRNSTGPVTGSARLDVCGGVCGTYEILFTISVDKKAPPPTTTKAPTTTTRPSSCPAPKWKLPIDTGAGESTVTAADECPPEAYAHAPSGTAVPGKPFTLEYSAFDDSGKATVYLQLYQGGTRVAKERVLPGPATGGTSSYTYGHLARTLIGPLFFCVWAQDAAGNRSAANPKSSCAWVPLLVGTKSPGVSNGCGGKGWETLVWVENYFGNKHVYKDARLGTSYTVDFTPACDLHDAGYAGLMVDDPINHRPVDYRGWSRMQVDTKFWNDMRKLCRAVIPPAAGDAGRACEGDDFPYSIGAGKLHQFVNDYGDLFFDADLTKPGEQETGNPKALPKGGARNNGAPKCKQPFPIGFVHSYASTRCKGSATPAFTPKISLAPNVIARGKTGILRGTGWKPKQKTDISLATPKQKPEVIRSVTTTARGTFAWRFDVNAKASPGVYFVSVCQSACKLRALTTLTVK